MRDHSIQVTRDYEDSPPVVVLEGEMRQVLANLIGNAIDAMTGCDGPRELVLRARQRYNWQTETAGLAVMVADRGTGMSRATLERIYEPFFSTKGITGTGLGLWVTHEILRKHNAHLKVATRQKSPSGTVFRIFLPLITTLSDDPYETGMPALRS